MHCETFINPGHFKLTRVACSRTNGKKRQQELSVFVLSFYGTCISSFQDAVVEQATRLLRNSPLSKWWGERRKNLDKATKLFKNRGALLKHVDQTKRSHSLMFNATKHAKIF